LERFKSCSLTYWF